jgi:hypothetical protein
MWKEGAAEELQLAEQLGAALIMKLKFSDAPSMKVQTLTGVAISRRNVKKVGNLLK